jgi:hypothetical protein
VSPSGKHCADGVVHNVSVGKRRTLCQRKKQNRKPLLKIQGAGKPAHAVTSIAVKDLARFAGRVARNIERTEQTFQDFSLP